SLDDQLRGLSHSTGPVVAIQAIEAEYQSVVEKGAAARSHLKFATDTRVQVTGGLCPLLNESCNNIRPGITLEGHFDGEIERWQMQIARLTTDYTAVHKRLAVAKKQVEDK